MWNSITLAMATSLAQTLGPVIILRIPRTLAEFLQPFNAVLSFPVIASDYQE